MERIFLEVVLNSSGYSSTASPKIGSFSLKKDDCNH